MPELNSLTMFAGDPRLGVVVGYAQHHIGEMGDNGH